MTDLTIAEVVSLIEEGEEDESALSAAEVDVQDYDSEASDDENQGPGYTTIGDEDEDITASPVPDPGSGHETPTSFELPSISLNCGVIRPGSVVELHDQSGRVANGLISGDFLLVRAIIESIETEKVVLRGYRMRRCSYLAPLFDKKMNELFMLIRTSYRDDRPAFVQGTEEIDTGEVVSLRDCIFTHLSYDLLKLGHVNSLVPTQLRNDNTALKSWIFNRGTLICRWVHIVEIYDSKKSTSYAGEVRRMYKREVMDFAGGDRSTQPSLAATSRPTPQSSCPSATTSQSLNSVHKRIRSLEIVEPPPKRCRKPPKKNTTYTLGDGFCSCGGASAGARQAGLRILWGLEKCPIAMAAFKQNFPGAMHLEMDAWNFSDIIKRSLHGVDITHFSCPCQYWAECNTVAGVNDQANMETIYIPLGWLLKLKPRLFTMEQSPGLIKKEKHRLHFRRLLNDFLSAGYNVRYRVQNLAWLELGAQRRRLFFFGAKIGHPLPPFPKPKCGPPKSGLKRYVTIEDALRPLVQVESHLENHKYHQKQEQNRVDRPPVHPHVSMANCITTSGGDNVHYTGKRMMTVLELAALQGFGLDHQFTGSVSDAKQQCGNAFPPVSGKNYFLSCAATMEAFDNGLIDAEDEIQDLLEFLEQKEVIIEKDIIDIDRPSASYHTTPARPQYRYLSRLEKTIKPRFPLPLWGQNKKIQARIPRAKRAVGSSRTGLGGATYNRRSRTLSAEPREKGAMETEEEDSDEEIVFLGSRSKST